MLVVDKAKVGDVTKKDIDAVKYGEVEVPPEDILTSKNSN